MIHLVVNESAVFFLNGVPFISVVPAALTRYCCTQPAAARFWPSIEADENGVGVTLATGEQTAPVQLTLMLPTDSALALPPGPLAVWVCAPSVTVTVDPPGPSETVVDTVSPGCTVIPLPIDEPLIW